MGMEHSGQRSITARAGYEAQSVAVADVNGDRKMDLLVANAICAPSGCATGSVGVLLGNGDGTFQPAVTYDSGGFSAESLAVADINGDGEPDLLVANTCVSDGACVDGSVGVLLGNGDGTFQTAKSYGSDGTGASSIAVKDVNGDGKPDLVVANACGNDGEYGCMIGSLGVLLGNGNGTFRAAVNYASGGYEADAVAVGDVNGDGNPDLVVANQCGNSGNCDGVVGVLLGNGDGPFQPVVTYDSGGYDAESVAVADVNGDGKPDLVVANLCASSVCTNGGVVGVLLGNGNGTFQTPMSYGSGGQDAESVAVADLNGDGKLDLVVANGNGNVGVLLGNGDGTFQGPMNYGSGGASASSVVVADVNGDGKPDLVVANHCASSNCADGSVGVLLGNGDGTFQAAVSYRLGRGVYRCSRIGGSEQGWQAGRGSSERIFHRFRNDWLGRGAAWQWGWNISGGGHYIHAHSARGYPVTRHGGLRRRRQAGFGRGCWKLSVAR